MFILILYKQCFTKLELKTELKNKIKQIKLQYQTMPLVCKFPEVHFSDGNKSALTRH